MSNDVTMGGVVKTKFTPKVGVQRQRKSLPVVTSTALPTTPAQRTSARQMSPKKDGARVSFAPHVAYKLPPSMSVSSASATSRSSHVKPRVSSTVEVSSVSNNKFATSDGEQDEQRDEQRDEQEQGDARYAPITLPFTSASIDGRDDAIRVDDELILFQLPTALPMSLPSPSPLSSSLSAEALSRLPSGHLGTLRRHLSGRQTLTIGDIVYDVTAAVECSNDQSVIHVDTAAATFAHVGNIIARANISIDVDAWQARNVTDKHTRADELTNKIHNKIKHER